MNSLPSLSGSDVSFGTLFDDRTIHETVINFTCLGRKLECVGFYEGLRIARLTEEQTLVSKVEQAGIKHLTTNCSSAEELIKQYPAVESNEGQSLVTFLTTLLAVHENNEILKGRFHYSGPKSPPYHFDVSNALPLTVSLNSVGSSDLVIRLRLLVGDSELFSDLVRLSWVKLIGLLNAGHLSLMRPGEPPHQREHPRRTVVTTRCVRLGLGNPSSEATGLIVRNYRASIKTLYEKVREADKAAERSRKAFLKIKNGHDGHLLDNITDAIVLKGVSKAFAKLSGNVSAVLREDRSFREKDPYLEIMVNPLECSSTLYRLHSLLTRCRFPKR